MNLPTTFRFKTISNQTHYASVVSDKVFVDWDENDRGPLCYNKEDVIENINSAKWVIVPSIEEAEHLQHVKQSFNNLADKQELKGLEKYGKPLDPLDNYDWLTMAAEESVDQYKYLEAERKKRTFGINKIRRLLNRESYDVAEIHHWLDWMEGKFFGEFKPAGGGD